jgi:hypothetical protein
MDGFAGWIECNEAGLNNFKLSSTLTSKEERNGLYHHIGMQRQPIFSSKRSLIAQFEPKSPVQESTAATFGICFATEATPNASANGGGVWLLIASTVRKLWHSTTVSIATLAAPTHS